MNAPRFILTLFVVLAAFAPAPVSGSQTHHTLPNGLTVVVEERPTSRAASLTLMIGAGSRDDGETPGLLYFLSRAHLLGTPRRPSEGAVQQAITTTGGSIVRGTSRETTQFAVTVPAEDVDIALDVLADILQHSLLNEDALEREKQVVAYEITRRRSNPSEVASDLLYGALFEGHPLQHPIVGNTASIASLDRGALDETRSRYYVARNMVLAVVGRVETPRLLEKVSRYFGPMPSGERNVAEASPRERPGVTVVEERSGRQQAIVQLAVRGPAAGHPDRYPFMVLDDVLGLISGRIFREVRANRGLAYVAGSGYGAFQDTGVWTAYAGTDPRHADEVASLLLAEMRRVREEPVPDDELRDAISHAVGRQLVGGESTSAKAQALARRANLGLAETDDSIIASFQAVTAQDVQRVAQQYLDPERYVLATVRP